MAVQKAIKSTQHKCSAFNRLFGATRVVKKLRVVDHPAQDALGELPHGFFGIDPGLRKYQTLPSRRRPVAQV
jgi:hypothetical protein